MVEKSQIHRKLSGSSYLPNAGHTFVGSVCLCSFRVWVRRGRLAWNLRSFDQRHIAPHPVRTWFVQIPSFLPGSLPGWATVGHHGESKWSHLPLVPSHCVSQDPVPLSCHSSNMSGALEPESTHLNLQVLPWPSLVWLLSLVNIIYGSTARELGTRDRGKVIFFLLYKTTSLWARPSCVSGHPHSDWSLG